MSTEQNRKETMEELNPERINHELDKMVAILEGAYELDAEALASAVIILESPLGKSLMPVIAQKYDRDIDFGAIAQLVRLVLFFKEEVKKLESRLIGEKGI
jgi:hypothetical protein